MSQFGLSGDEDGGEFVSLHFSLFQCLTLRDKKKMAFSVKLLLLPQQAVFTAMQPSLHGNSIPPSCLPISTTLIYCTCLHQR